jgi:hypothetical protein
MPRGGMIMLVSSTALRRAIYNPPCPVIKADRAASAMSVSVVASASMAER